MNRRRFLLNGLTTGAVIAAGLTEIERHSPDASAAPVNSEPGVESGPAVYPTGCVQIDRALHGGIRDGSLLVVIGPAGSGKTDFVLRMATANGIANVYPANRGTSDMLSIVRSRDGRCIGSAMSNGTEPSTDKEQADIRRDPAARDAFLTRWFRRTKEVLRESGGIFVLTVRDEIGPTAASAGWRAYPDVAVQAEGSQYRVIQFN